MKFEQYITTASTLAREYYFTSIGKKGVIEKTIQYSLVTGVTTLYWETGKTENCQLYNLGFGDLKEDGSCDDEIQSKNGDMNKVLATVANTTINFTNENPDSYVIATGSNDARTRIYRQMIFKYFSDISEYFNIYGYTEAGRFVPFSGNVNFLAFLIKKNGDEKE
ncbi:MAG: hypothetical protein JWP12_877 [Bacteroidetes bacterium]|nr:hypothetical protein [Bacteroidota bacterium]